jgi:hypothetical protein
VSDRRLFLHAGTHKTGTTSLQAMMAQNRRRLEKSGVLYPEAGRRATPEHGEMDGHHNIAWEMTGDERFDEQSGTFAQLLDEISGRKQHVAVVSSEDFEYLHRRPEALAAMASGIRAIDYAPVAVLYLRSQADYAQSLYAELAGYHGLAVSFDAFLDRVAEQGSFEFRGWTFAFDYEALTRPFADALGKRSLVVRAYERDRTPDDLLRGFAGLFLEREGEFKRLKKPARVNEAPTLGRVLESLRTTLGVAAPEVPGGADRDALLARFDLLSNDEAAAFQGRFRESNERIAAEFGVSVPGPATNPDPLENDKKVKRAEAFRAAFRAIGQVRS